MATYPGGRRKRNELDGEYRRLVSSNRKISDNKIDLQRLGTSCNQEPRLSLARIPTLSGKDTVRGTQEELYEPINHYLAYCGRYDLAEANGEFLVKCNCKLPLFPTGLDVRRPTTYVGRLYGKCHSQPSVLHAVAG